MCKIHGPGRLCMSRAPYGRDENAAAAAARQRADNRSGDTPSGLAAADAARGRRGSQQPLAGRNVWPAADTGVPVSRLAPEARHGQALLAQRPHAGQ